jgi:hypothetical protein
MATYHKESVMLQRYVTKGLISISGVLIVMFMHGTVLHADTTPPEGTDKAELGFPPAGTKWVRKIVVHGKNIIITRTYTVLEESSHGGKPVYRISDGAKISLFDKATRNLTADVRAGEELNSASPYVPAYDFPLWVGKSWETTFAYNDREREATFENIVWRGRVTAYEDVTVPAGTFKTFRVEGTDGGGVKVILWYSPKLNIAVKSSLERLPGHYIGPGKFTSELTEYPAK